MDAEDALHDCYVALLERDGNLVESADAEHWLIRVMVNRCLLQHRKHRRWQRAFAWLKWQPRSENHDDNEDAKEIVRQCMAEIPPAQGAMLALRYFCDFDASEIGELLSMKPASVRSELRRIRLHLAERLIEKGVTGDAI